MLAGGPGNPHTEAQYPSSAPTTLTSVAHIQAHHSFVVSQNLGISCPWIPSMQLSLFLGLLNLMFRKHESHHDLLQLGHVQKEFFSTGKQKPTFSSSCFLTGLPLPPLHILPVRNNTNELVTFLPFSGRQASCSLWSSNTWNLHFLGGVLSSILHSLILCINTFPLSPCWKIQENALSFHSYHRCP